MTGHITRRDALKTGVGAGTAGIGSVHSGRLAFAAADRTYDLAIEAGRITIDGESSDAILMGGSVPAPVLRWREGEEVVVHATNRLAETTSIHWHGILLPGAMDGSPGFNGFTGIEPGATFTYRFRLRQGGTYWYHSHSAMQEQSGMYGALVIEPDGREPIRYDRDHVVLLSDHTPEHPRRVLNKLKVDAGYYNRGQRTLLDFFRDAGRGGIAPAVADRLAWGEMRMDPTDLVDVAGYAFLVNGKGPEDSWTGLFEPGERIRLRFVNASAMSIMDVRIPGLPMTVVAADGQFVQPVKVDEFRFGVGETYDVLVLPREPGPFTIFAEPLDRSGYARATLAVREDARGEIPERRPRAELAMADMGAAHGMDHRGKSGAHAGHQMAGGPEHGGMAGMDHGPSPAQATATGWADAGTPPGMKALAYRDLRALQPNEDLREPSREIEIRLDGVMERYVWTLNGEPFEDAEPIRAGYGERLRIRFVNQTMMAHPMHLHGMFMELENGQGGHRPKKHIVLVAPGQEARVLLTADEPGEWPLHCHLMYHMASGMMTRLVVEQRTAARR